MKSSNLDKRIWAVFLILAQAVTIISTFFWQANGRHTLNGSVLVYFSSLFWIIAFIGLFDLLKVKYPKYATLGLIYAIYGAVGGIAFAFEGLYSEIFQVSDKIGVEAYKDFPTQMNLVLFWAGPAFPLSLMCYGIVLIFSKLYKPWVGSSLFLGGLTFPISRILRIEWLAHLNDLALFLPLAYFSYIFWKNEAKGSE